MSKSVLGFTLIALCAVGLGLFLFLEQNKGAHMVLEGSIKLVRVLQLEPDRSLLICDFRLTNPAAALRVCAPRDDRSILHRAELNPVRSIASRLQILHTTAGDKIARLATPRFARAASTVMTAPATMMAIASTKRITLR